MRLLSARIIGFQSFTDTGELAFDEGMNLVVGQNNAGKSALLRALLASMPNDPHRSPAEWREQALAAPTTSFSIHVSGSELVDGIFASGARALIPTAAQAGTDPRTYARELLNRKAIDLRVSRQWNATFSSDVYPSHGLFEFPGHGSQPGAAAQAINGKLEISEYNNGEDTIPALLHFLWKQRVFYFSAERLTIGEGQAAHVARLDPNASNLAAVLNTLQSDSGDVFRRLVGHLTEIFPTVGNLSTRISPQSSQILEIRVWPTAAQERVELSFPLQQSGTGVAQMIALLTAVMTVEKAVIVIDEINSFLHPAAVKALLRILRTEYGQHQYIISTHAPEVVGFSNPSTIHLVRRAGYESTVERLNITDVGAFREVAAHLGVSMADVFAAERVVWVEGESEETLFPFLYRELVGPVPTGTIFTAVVATGDFGAKKRDKAMVYQAYTRLSEAVATLPVRVVFGFDTETLSDREKQDMVRDSGGRLHFLPRRHLECFLLNPDAIAERIRAKDPVANIDGSGIRERLLALAAEQRFSIGIDPDLTDENWLKRVDAAKLLSALFGDITEHRATFEKTSDVVELARLILKSSPEQLTPLIEYVTRLVEDVSKQ